MRRKPLQQASPPEAEPLVKPATEHRVRPGGLRRYPSPGRAPRTLAPALLAGLPSRLWGTTGTF
jgi:hypothetical protein